MPLPFSSDLLVPATKTKVIALDSPKMLSLHSASPMCSFLEEDTGTDLDPPSD